MKVNIIVVMRAFGNQSYTYTFIKRELHIRLELREVSGLQEL